MVLDRIRDSLGLARVEEGTGELMVLLHGGTGSWTHWIRNMPTLSRHYRVRAYDLPGFGDSPAFGETDPGAYFRRVADAILEEDDRPLRLVGFSFGGSVAAGIAPLLGSRLRALTLVAPGSFGVPAPRKIDVQPVRARPGLEIDSREAARHNLTQIMFKDPAMADAPTVDIQLANIARSRFNSRRISWHDRIDADLAAVGAPTQMIWGLADRMATPSVEARVERCRRASPSLRFDLIPDAGHWVQYERPDDFNSVLLDFHCGLPVMEASHGI